MLLILYLPHDLAVQNCKFRSLVVSSNNKCFMQPVQFVSNTFLTLYRVNQLHNAQTFLFSFPEYSVFSYKTM